MSDDTAYQEFKEALSDVLADRRLAISDRRARLDRLFVARVHVDTNDPRYADAVARADEAAAGARAYSEKKNPSPWAP